MFEIDDNTQEIAQKIADLPQAERERLISFIEGFCAAVQR